MSTIYIAPSGISALKQYEIPTFGMSCYFIALETDYWNGQGCITSNGYSGATPNQPNIPGTFCNSFLNHVMLQGSGVTRGGASIRYDAGSDTFQPVAPPIAGADGPLIAGQTVARDYAIIPKNANVTVSLDSIGDVRATDSGSLESSPGLLNRIAGYRLDLYMGAGKNACAGYNNPIVVGSCSPATQDCPTGTIQ